MQSTSLLSKVSCPVNKVKEPKMPRIIGQCNTATFKDIEHLASVLHNPEMLDVSTLSRKQRLAFLAMAALLKSGIKRKELYKIREILFWDDGHIEFKLLNVPGARELLEKLNLPKTKTDFGRGLDSMLQD